MKKRYYYLLSVSVLALLSNSCKKLEKEPLELLSPDYVWDTQDSAGVNANKVLTDIYSMIIGGHNRILNFTAGDNGFDFLDASTDDAISSSVGIPPVQLIATGAGFSPFLNSEGGSFGTNYWALMYTGIRKANIFIANIDKVPLFGTLPGNRPVRSAWKAEARFLRAFFYFELVKRYGGVPLMGDAVRQITDKVLLPRNSFEECVNYIASECDAVKDSLRYDPIDDGNFGRATRGTAMALKARVLLYAASPLYNGGNTGTTPAQILVAGYPNYDVARWKAAADAAKAIMDLGVFDVQPEFINTFIIPNNIEVIFARNNGPGTGIENTNGPIGYNGNAQGNGRTSPTQDLVDAFGTLDGKSITDPTSGYNPQNPYINRDPRLDKTIIHNGSTWLNTTIETFEGGRSKPGGAKMQTKTSYYLRKFMGNFENQTAYSPVSHNFIIFRYAEVLLNFAEAQNEVSGPNSDIYEALYKIRHRAGIKPGTDAHYGLSSSLNQAQMREVIRNERRVELAFEEHRFWDIRRWKIAENLNGHPLHGLKIVKGNVAGTLVFSQTDVLTPVFDKSKMYLFPISQGEIDKDINLIQNPGW